MGGGGVSWRVTVRLFAGGAAEWLAPLGMTRSEAGDWARDLLWPHADAEPLGTVQAILPADGVS